MAQGIQLQFNVMQIGKRFYWEVRAADGRLGFVDVIETNKDNSNGFDTKERAFNDLFKVIEQIKLNYEYNDTK